MQTIDAEQVVFVEPITKNLKDLQAIIPQRFRQGQLCRSL